MSFTTFLFAVFPYIAFGILSVVTVLRWRRHPFSVSSLSSQLLESRRLYWGSVSFHWGLSLVLVGHLAALIVPRGFEIWNGASLRLYLLEATGLALGLWAGFGLIVLLWRRLGNPRIRAVTSPMDLVVLTVLAVQVASGLWIAVGYRWGSYWGTSVLVPYVRSVLTLSPDARYVEPLPLVVQLHVFTFWVFVAVFAFSRLVHIITLPPGYLVRPWQRVIRNADEPGVFHPASDRPIEKIR
ncbi:MAG: respiratory nitrate reductase subunit gamma [Acidimicrobiia bacterium]|nr:respiratory nitrate reductase subunit gamma [Acidimicrobiia bacterium]